MAERAWRNQQVPHSDDLEGGLVGGDNAAASALPNGSKLATLRDAIAYLGKVIPNPTTTAVLTAAEVLPNAAENGPHRICPYRTPASQSSRSPRL